MKKNWKKWLGLTLAAMILISLGGIVGARFTDQGTVQGTVTSGTLDLRFGEANTTQTASISNMAPTETKSMEWPMKNVGTVDGVIKTVSVNLTQAGGTHTDAEVRAGDTANVGNLYDYLRVKAWIGTTLVGSGDLHGLVVGDTVTFNNLNVPLGASAGATVKVEFTWPETNLDDNRCQGDILTASATVYLEQRVT